jgi:hypothetical protein
MTIGAAAVLLLLAQAETPPASEAWRESASDGGTVLSSGDPDHALVQFRCVRRGVVRAYLGGLYTGDGPEPHRVTVRSGRARSVYRLQSGVDNQGGFSADIPIQSSTLVSFERSGELSFVAAGAEVGSERATRAEIEAISAFLRRCGGG